MIVSNCKVNLQYFFKLQKIFLYLVICVILCVYSFTKTDESVGLIFSLQSISKSIGIEYCHTFLLSYWYWYWQYFLDLVLVLIIAILFVSIVNNPEVYTCSTEVIINSLHF